MDMRDILKARSTAFPDILVTQKTVSRMTESSSLRSDYFLSLEVGMGSVDDHTGIATLTWISRGVVCLYIGFTSQGHCMHGGAWGWREGILLPICYS